MRFDVLHNFISPVTGRILSDPDYVLVGDLGGIAMPSPILIDIRLDIIALRKDLTLTSDASFIIGFPNDKLPNAQVLQSLADGYIFTTAGIVSTAPITQIGNVKGPEPAFSIEGNVAIWDGESGRKIKDSEFSIAKLEMLAEEAAASAEEAAASAEEAAASAVEAEASAVEATSAAEAASDAAAAAIAAAAGSAIGGIFGSIFGSRSRGRTGAAGKNGLPGVPGAAGSAGKETLVIDSNISVLGGRIQDIAASPEADYDAVNAKWVWDLLNDNVEIKWG